MTPCCNERHRTSANAPFPIHTFGSTHPPIMEKNKNRNIFLHVSAANHHQAGWCPRRCCCSCRGVPAFSRPARPLSHGRRSTPPERERGLLGLLLREPPHHTIITRRRPFISPPCSPAATVPTSMPAPSPSRSGTPSEHPSAPPPPRKKSLCRHPHAV